MSSTHGQRSLPNMTDEEFQRFREFVYAKTHIHCDDSKRPLFERKVRSRLKELHLESYCDYYLLLTEARTATHEQPNFLEHILVHETSFFRIRDHFRALQERILPEFFHGSPAQTLRIWSAGCSTGEEPYSIALSILDYLHHVETPSFSQAPAIKILANDFSLQAIQKARQGRYSRQKVEKIPQALLDKYFVSRNDHFQLTESVTQLVSFDVSNLIRPHATHALRFHAIFCRNVMIYFDRQAQMLLLKDIISRLAPGGYLFLGDAEATHVFPEITRELEQIPVGQALIYKKHGVQS